MGSDGGCWEAPAVFSGVALENLPALANGRMVAVGRTLDDVKGWSPTEKRETEVIVYTQVVVRQSSNQILYIMAGWVKNH